MAASQMIFSILISCYVLKSVCAQSVSIAINPNPLLLTSNTTSLGGHVNISCKASDVQGTVVTMSINRDVTKDDPPGGFVTLRPGAVQGYFNGTGATIHYTDDMKELTVQMPKTKCDEAGNYTCKMNFVTDLGSVLEKTDQKALDVEVNPEQVSLKAYPVGKTDWVVNETLTIICNGVVGTVKGDTQVEWIWERRKVSLGSWERYRDESITEGDETKSLCYRQRSSTLMRKVTKEDDDAEYRCYISRDGEGFPQFGASHSVGTVSEESITTPATNPDNGAASKADVGPIIGGVIGGLVVIIVIIVVVVFLVRRRRSGSEGAGAEGEAAGKKPDEPGAQPYAPNPAVSYSQPNRFRHSREPQGVTNTAMDEMGDKPPYRYNDDNDNHHHPQPPRYANDFHQGRRNRGYDYDPEGRGRSRGHSSDDDGTDSRVNTSQHSIGYGDPSIGTAI